MMERLSNFTAGGAGALGAVRLFYPDARVEWRDVMWLCILTVVLTLAATVRDAIRSSKKGTRS